MISGNYTDLPNGYLETINKGIEYVRRLRGSMTSGIGSRGEAAARLKNLLPKEE